MYGKYQFEDRRKNKEKLCIVLAGYKDYLWDTVFDRLFAYIPDDIEVCIMSSGKYSKELSQLCEAHNCSYLSTKENKLTLIQNIAIHLHPNAKFIHKLDEDIFITKDYFEMMEKTYWKATEDKYDVGFVGALLPLNGYGFKRVLEKLNLLEEVEEKFNVVQYGEMKENPAYLDVEFAKYMWGEGGTPFSNIDLLAEQFAREEIAYGLAPFRFAIGAIMFPRSTWKDMGMFPVEKGWNMGIDEQAINSFCFRNSRVIAVSENAFAGHFGYYYQSEGMKQYYKDHKEIFCRDHGCC